MYKIYTINILIYIMYLYAVKFSFWDGTSGFMYLSFNIIEKLTVLLFLGTPFYLIKIILQKN